MAKGLAVGLILISICASCIGARATAQIPDYLIVPNGIENLGSAPLNAFIFENNVKNTTQIEEFVANKYQTGNNLQHELWITIDKSKYKLIIYDNDEFEKYFNSANYSPINLEVKNDRYYSNRKFIAISMISFNNEDCLATHSLLLNIATNYLKDLKNEYLFNEYSKQ